MASNHGNTHSEPAKMEQIITELFAKSLHIVLESRCPYVSSRNYSGEQVLSSPSSSSSSSSFRPRDKWFNLALKDCPAALENIDFWRQSNLEPMIIDVVLVQRPKDFDPLSFSPKRGLVRNLSGKGRFSYGSDNDEFGGSMKSEKIIERWVLQYESKKSGGNSGSVCGNKRSMCTSSQSLYKKSILLLRSLYSTVRLLPAYKLFRDLISSAQIRSYNLSHRISSFVEPFTRREEANMQKFAFAPLDTCNGRLCLFVFYSPAMLDSISEPSTPISPQFIPEYVGSPMAERLKRFPSGPVSPSSPFGRRHSWSYDIYRASPPLNLSPSPTYSESHVLISKQNLNRLPPSSLPRHFPDESPQVHMKEPSFDEYWPSPVFSPSPSPSPPTYVQGSRVSKALLRSESAPLAIPASRFSSIPLLSNNQMLPPSPPSQASLPSGSKKDGRFGLQQMNLTVDKLYSSVKDEAGKASRLKPIDDSPSKSFSRSSSRLSFQDDYDDSEFSGPFVVEYDDMTDHSSRPASFDQQWNPSGPHELGGLFPAKKSQDAAVGALFHMLKKAPPLHQDVSVTKILQPDLNIDMPKNNSNEVPPVQHSASLNFSSSSLLSSKTMADALEELRVYREMKDSLLKQSKSSEA